MTDREGLTKLLDFLACSFGGGTDVAAPLRRAMDVLEAPQASDVVYAGADVLLVSDGELPNPPLDAATHARLRTLQRSQGVEVHGLLVGAPRVTPLDQMCDEVHMCLSKFDPLLIMRQASDGRRAAAAEEDSRGVVRPTANSVGGGGASPAAAWAARKRGSALQMCAGAEAGAEAGVDAGAGAGVHAEADEAARPLRERASLRAEALLRAAAEQMGTGRGGGGGAGSLEGSAPRAAALRRATELLESGLVEREGEARLLLLALVGGEHLLLLGPPGTAKSALCRRLSTIASLSYFERTLTRFSTPEVARRGHPTGGP